MVANDFGAKEGVVFGPVIGKGPVLFVLLKAAYVMKPGRDFSQAVLYGR